MTTTPQHSTTGSLPPRDGDPPQGLLPEPTAALRRLIVETLTQHINTHGDISNDPDDINDAASAIWDALDIPGTQTVNR